MSKGLEEWGTVIDGITYDIANMIDYDQKH